ncbi:K(lysine) acetyltransferase [Parelaphostrongylus tenuis]|uniref:Histone acetyltransferase n=1 Tax=Parelaphostrongylus tenuis TaxID=148309 RepID=A0AAD5QWF0_PARTN|nr:K(lysine) acetyltransferase [Parelaphostrongylus tenuis]
MPILDVESVLVGETYLVRGRRGRWRNATVLDKRGSENGGPVELYVHFDGDDRRLDRWIDSRRLKLRTRSEQPSKLIIGCEIREKRVRKAKEISPASFKVDYTDVLEEEHKEVTKTRGMSLLIRMNMGKERYLFICDYCFLYMRQERAYKMHLSSCNARQPPGKEIYHDSIENIIVYEVDGSKERLFCQCLCLFAKLFMDHKTIYFDVNGFLFYVICEWDGSGARPVGYFPKSRQGYGSFLIQLSYELSRREGVNGSPEKPLSDLGLMSYRHFWAYMIVDHLMTLMDMSWIRITHLANVLGMQIDDVIVTLKWLQLYEPPVVEEAPEGIEPCVVVPIKKLENLRKLVARPPRLMMKARLLRWRPNV